MLSSPSLLDEGLQLQHRPKRPKQLDLHQAGKRDDKSKGQARIERKGQKTKAEIRLRRRGIERGNWKSNVIKLMHLMSSRESCLVAGAMFASLRTAHRLQQVNLKQLAHLCKVAASIMILNQLDEDIVRWRASNNSTNR